MKKSKLIPLLLLPMALLASCGNNNSSVTSSTQPSEVSSSTSSKESITSSEHSSVKPSEVSSDIVSSVVSIEEESSEVHTCSFDNLIQEKAPTCTSTGLKAHYYCEVCDKYYTADKVECTYDDLILPIAEHSYSEGEVTSEPTFAEDGIITKTCSECGATTSETIAKYGVSGQTNPLKVPGVHTVIDFDGADVVYWERYYNKAVATKHGVEDLINTDMTHIQNNGGGDYDGSSDPNSGAVISANGEKSKSFAHANGGNIVTSDITVSKYANIIKVYSGVWGNDSYSFNIKSHGVLAYEHKWTVNSEIRAYEIVFTLDTSSWADDKTDTVTLELVPENPAASMMVAGIALCTSAENYQVSIESSPVLGASVTLDAETIMYGENVSGTVTSDSVVLGVNLNGKFYATDSEGKFSVRSSLLGVSKDMASVVVEPVLSDIKPTFNVRRDVTSANFDAEGIIYFERFYNSSSEPGVKADAEDLITSSEFIGYSRGGGDYGIDITANGETNQSFVCTNQAGTEKKSFSTMIKIVKGVSKISIYTGTWDGSTDMNVSLERDGVIYGTVAFTNEGTRVNVVEMNIDTSTWEDGRVEEFDLRLHHTIGQSMMCAGIVFE